MTANKLTIGQAIDQVINALEMFEEKSKQTILLTACTHFGLELSQQTVSNPPHSPSLTPSAPTPTAEANLAKPHTSRVVDIRSLKQAKSPTNAIQMACVVAFYLSEYASGDERKTSVKSEDLEKHFKQAGFKLPSRIAQVLIDAKAAGYFESVGRGEYKLNAVGYNLVAHSLPSAASTK